MRRFKLVGACVVLASVLSLGALTRSVRAEESCGTCQCYLPNLDEYGYIDTTTNACVECPYCNVIDTSL